MYVDFVKQARARTLIPYKIHAPRIDACHGGLQHGIRTTNRIQMALERKRDPRKNDGKVTDTEKLHLTTADKEEMESSERKGRQRGEVDFSIWTTSSDNPRVWYRKRTIIFRRAPAIHLSTVSSLSFTPKPCVRSRIGISPHRSSGPICLPC